jgi:hypothetical protein
LADKAPTGQRYTAGNLGTFFTLKIEIDEDHQFTKDNQSPE